MNQYPGGFNHRMAKYRIQAIKYLLEDEKCGSLMDLGCATGDLTNELAPLFDKVTGIDINEEYIQKAAENAKNGTVFAVQNALLVEPWYKPDVVLAYTLFEHVEDEDKLLENIEKMLDDNGTVIVGVPNAASMHKRVGLKMGLIDSLWELQPQDLEIGHVRYYTIDDLIESVGRRFDITGVAGVLIKPFQQSRMDELNDETLDVLFEHGLDHPEMCAEILVKARKC